MEMAILERLSPHQWYTEVAKNDLKACLDLALCVSLVSLELPYNSE